MLQFGVLVKAEPKALQALMGHKKIKTTMDIYAEAMDEIKEASAEEIEGYFTSLSLSGTSEDYETMIQNLQKLDITILDEKEIRNLKREIIRLVNIPKLEQKVNNTILNLSNIEEGTDEEHLQNILLKEQKKLELIQRILKSFNLFKTQTIELKRNKNNCNDKNKYICKYLLNTQELLRNVYNYEEQLKA